ncbi:MAG: thioesterase [Bacillota bacterium]|nr:thioesterase [Bacillota bacterium]
MRLRQDFFVGVQDVDVNKKLTNHALLEKLSDISMLHGAKAGHTATSGTSAISWVVLGWKVKVYQRPSLFSTIRVYTWVQKYGYVRANRDFLVEDENGTVIAVGTSEWTPIDTKTDKFIRITPELVEPFEPEPENVNFPDHHYPAFRRFEMVPDKTRQIELNSAMFDYNRHVHNSVYLILAEQIVPEEVTECGCDEFEIVYKMETTTMDPVRLEYKCEEDSHIVAIRDCADNTLHAVVTMY